jgi:hypothetical protein
VDPRERAIHWLGLVGGSYVPIKRSKLIALGAGELATQLAWEIALRPRWATWRTRKAARRRAKLFDVVLQAARSSRRSRSRSAGIARSGAQPGSQAHTPRGYGPFGAP